MISAIGSARIVDKSGMRRESEKSNDEGAGLTDGLLPLRVDFPDECLWRRRRQQARERSEEGRIHDVVASDDVETERNLLDALVE